VAHEEELTEDEEVFLNKKEEHPKRDVNESLWYLDNGASNRLASNMAHITEMMIRFKEMSDLGMVHG
jgi:hypothetical protein